jgi:hypothetical protein
MMDGMIARSEMELPRAVGWADVCMGKAIAAW